MGFLKDFCEKYKLIMRNIKIETLLLSLVLFFGSVQGVRAQFTPGNIIVLQTKGTASKGPSRAVLREFTANGSAGITVALDSASTATSPYLTAGQYGGSESFLTTSSDGQYLILAGFRFSSAADITATTSASVNRVVGKVNAAGVYSQMFSSNTFFTGNDIRGAVSDGTNVWAAGASNANTDGIDYYGPASQAPLATSATPPKAYGLRIFNNQIYYTTQKAGPTNTNQFGVFALGNGLPTGGTVTVSAPIINVTSPAGKTTAIPEDFSFSIDGKTCYIAINVNSSVGGIQKWTNTSPWSLTGWVYQYTLSTGVANVGAYGLVVDYSGSNPVLYATTFEAQSSGNRVIKITDSGSAATASTLVNAVPGVTNKGITFSPGCAVPSGLIASSNSPVCSGGSLNLNATANGSAPFNYSWSGPNMYSSSMQSPVIPNVLNAATGIYTVTVSNSCGNATASAAVTVSNSPIASITPDGSTSFCSGGAVNLASSIGASYSWSTGATTQSIHVNTSGTYSVFVTNSVNCTTASAPLSVTVTPSVMPDIRISPDAGASICPGTQVTFTASPTNSGAAPMYQWILNGNNVGTNNPVFVISTLADSDIVACTIASNATCASPVSVHSNSVTMHVTATVTPSVTIASASGNTNCSGALLTFNATGINGGVKPSYQWKVDGTNAGIDSSVFSTTSIANQDVVTCVLTSSNACSSTPTTVSNALTMTVNPILVPSLSIVVSPDSTVCAGTNVTFTATSHNGGSSPAFQWTLNGNNVGSSSPTYSNSSMISGSSVKCMLTSNAACAMPSSALSNAISVQVLPLPAQPAAFATKTTFVYQNQNAVMYAVPSLGGLSYSWSYTGTGVVIHGSGNSVLVDYGSNASSGTLSVTANNSCGAGPSRALAIAVNAAILISKINYDYGFITIGCNRVDYLDTTFTTGDPDYSCGHSTANVYQLKRLFTEINHLDPLPKYLFMTGDIVMGYKNDTVALATQLTAWRAIYENHPLSSSGIQLIVIPGNHETEDKANAKKAFVAAERTFVRIMSPYIKGNNGPGIGGPDNLATDQSRLTYSFNNGSDHFIVINTDPVGADGITPYKWIGNDIIQARANNARHIFAFGHKPAYSSPISPQGGLDAPPTLSQRDSLWKYLENNNCEALFSAHEHLWDSIHPHTGKTWDIINGNGGTRVEVPWVGAGKQYYGYTLVNLYTDRKVNVMGLGRNTGMGTTAGQAPYPINEDASPTSIRNSFNICLGTSSVNNVLACDSYNWNGTVYTSSGKYVFKTSNITGCDSVATLNLTINRSSSSSMIVSACNSYNWNGNVYTASGSYVYHTLNAAGCDSTANLNLTIKALPGDFDNNGVEDVNDFNIFIGKFNENCTCDEDMDRNGKVDINDFVLFIENFGLLCH
jgi:hypothetical protein